MMGPIIGINDVTLLDMCISLCMVVEAQLTLGLPLALDRPLLCLLWLLGKSSHFLFRLDALSWVRYLKWILISGPLACS